MVTKGEVVARSGKVIKVEVDTICVHGDNPTSVEVAKAVRAALDAAGIEVVALPELMGSL
ncbi:MAG: LamB/YcsF family protein, partial [Hyphomicrobiaceae bacterium]